MVNIGGDPLSTKLKVPGTRVFVSIDGSTYGLMENHDWQQGYREQEDYVGGTPTPLQTPGGFHGEFTPELIFSTDLPKNMTTLSYGDLPTHVIVILAKNVNSDNSSDSSTMTINYAKCFQEGGTHRKDNLYRYKFRFLFSAPVAWS